MLIKQYLFTLIKKQKLLFISMALMSALSFSIFVGLSYADNNYKISMNNYFEDYNYPSAFITTDFTNEETYDCLESVEGLNNFDVRFYSLFNINANNEYLNIVLSTYKPNDFTKFAYMSEYVASNNIEVLVDQQFADANNIKVGDTITIGKKGHFCPCTVSQIVLKPENFCVYALGDIPTDNIGYGAAFIKHEDLEQFLHTIEIDNYGLDSNQVLLDIDPSFDKQEVLENCCKKLLESNNANPADEHIQEEMAKEIDIEILEKYNINPENFSLNIDPSSYNQANFENVDTNITNKFNIISSVIDDDTPPVILSKDFISQFGALTSLIPLAFLLIMSLVFILFLIQIIKKQSREIGIFLAFGFDKKSIYALFSCFTLSISILSIILGLIFSNIISNISYSLYKSSAYIPSWTEEYSFGKTIIICLVIIIVGQLACAISATAFAKSSPMDALDKNYQDYILLGKRIEKIAYKIPTALRLSLNSIIQNSRNFIIVVLGFIASFVLTFSSVSMSSSMKKYINYTYDVQRNYDVRIVSSIGASEKMIEELNKCECITEFQTYNSISTNIVCGDKSKKIKVIDFPNESNMLQFYDANTGEKMSIPEKGIILDKLTADAIDAKVGNKVMVCDKKFNVVAIADIYNEQYGVISTDEMKNIEEEKNINVIANITNTSDFEDFCAFSESELCPIFTSNFKQMEINFKKAINTTVSIAIVVSILLGFVVVCTINLMTIEKQKRILSILRTQGMSLFAISNYWGIQMIIQLFVAFLIGKPLGGVVARMFINTLTSENSYYPFVNEFSFYIKAFSFIVFFSLVAHIVIMTIVSKINIAENVQSRE